MQFEGQVAPRRRSLLRATLAGMALSIAAGLLGTAYAAAQETLRIRIGSDVTSFDPHRPSTIENTSFSVHVFDGLFTYNYADMSIVPHLVETFSVSDDGLVWTLNLRRGVQFHGGYGEMTADDVKFSMDRVMNPDNASPWAGELRGVTVDVAGEHTVVLTLPRPNANFLHTLTARNQALVLSRRALEEMGEDWVTRPIGTGAYMFESWRPGDRVTLVANPDHFRGAPQIERLEFVLIPEETSAEIALLNREIDVFFSLQSPEVIERLSGREGIRIDSRASLMSCHLALNATMPPLDNVLVRRAMMHAINRESLVNDFFRGMVSPTVSPLTPEYFEYTDDVPLYPYDPDRARALLAEAGLPNGFDFNYVTVALAPFDQFPIVVADDLSRVGIRVELTVMERATYGQARSSGNIPSATTCPANSPNPDTLLRTLFSSDGHPPGVNTARYTGVDALLEEARSTQDLAARTTLYHAIQRQIMEDLPTLPLYGNRLFTAMHDGVQGVNTSAAFWVDAWGATLTR